MIYDQADIVTRRLLGQKIGERAYYETAENASDIERLLQSQNRIIITAPRQSGKTTELLKFAERNNPYGNFAVVCLNQEMQRSIILRHLQIFTAGNVSKRLNGQNIESTEVNPPLCISPSNLSFLRGHRKPVFVDEFHSLTEDVQQEILDLQYFVAGVTS